MGGQWNDRWIAEGSRSLAAGVPRAVAQDTRLASDTVTAAVVGFVVALVTSLGVSIACVAYLR